MQTPGFADQLLDIHRDGNAFRDAARARAGFGSFRKLSNVDTVVLCRPGKSSEFGAILWLFCPETRVRQIATSGR
jgi:hypothetical protein